MTRIVFAVILLLMTGAVFFLGIMPSWQNVTDSRAEIRGLMELNDELREIAKTRDDLTARYNAIPQSDLNKLSLMIPSGLGSAEFLRDIEALTAAHAVSLRNLDFVIKESASASQIRLPSQGQAALVDLSFNMRSSYDSFRSFLRDLEKMLRIVDISEISFGTGSAPQAEQAGKTVSEIFDYSLKGAMYYFR